MNTPPHILKHRAIGAKRIKKAACDAKLEWKWRIEQSKRSKY